MTEGRKPDFSKPVDIQAYFYNEFAACGCSELDTMIAVVRELLEWVGQEMDSRVSYAVLFGGNVGIYYMLVGILDNADLCEHGCSIRHPWLTESGKALLLALQTTTAEMIDAAGGEEAYDGLYYQKN